MEKLYLENLTEKDWNEYYNLTKPDNIYDEEIRKYATGFLMDLFDDFKQLLSDYKLFKSQLIGIKNAQKVLLGVIALENVFEKGVYELSFFIGKKYRGNHYASQAISILIEILKDTNIKELVLFINKNNRVSLNIANFVLHAKYKNDFDKTEKVFTLDL